MNHVRPKPLSSKGCHKTPCCILPVKSSYCRRKSATKFLCVKTASDKVVATSLLYLYRLQATSIYAWRPLLQISCLLLKTHLINMSHKHSTKLKFGIKAIYQNLKWQVLWAMGGAYQNRESFIQCITRRSRLPAKVRDITHLYFVLLGQNVHWSKCSCVVAGLSCIDICSCALCWWTPKPKQTSRIWRGSQHRLIRWTKW